LNNTPEKCKRDILKADAALKVFHEGIRYFRTPMLQTGPARESKERLERFLSVHGYQQPPVTHALCGFLRPSAPEDYGSS
jgi:hypothetical protein